MDALLELEKLDPSTGQLPGSFCFFQDIVVQNLLRCLPVYFCLHQQLHLHYIEMVLNSCENK